MPYNQTESDTSIRYINIYINLFYLIFGNIGNLLKVAFFLQKPLRSLPCTMYILFSTVSDFVTLNNLPVLQLLIHLYPNYHWIKITVDWSNNQNDTVLLSHSISNYDIIMCKIRSYLHLLSTDLSFQMLLFASINRYCSTYRRGKRHNSTGSAGSFNKCFCSHPYIQRLCIISCIISALLSLQHIFNFTIKSPSEGCVPHHRILWVVWISSIHCFILPITMTIFGILTLRNIHCLSMFGDYFLCLKCHCHSRKKKYSIDSMGTYCSRCENTIQHRIDRQLTSMIISEIFVTVLTSLPYGTYALYSLLHTIQKRPILNGNQSIWIPLFVRTTMYLEPSCGFYIYLLTLSTLRKRFHKTFISKVTKRGWFCWK
ncbi:unnamed protein product [Adineta steineri]|uniref:G-protein coupled receptors family 1 profile domain-containing protein n=1 Tax=Adineta steineri TaxID=433720 RepID=A0A814NM63_9BILA|nr:unnamed protein product [Adineta steineri]CAF0981717.1 unnamed protein product [Adineta steineri]CAF1095657.1 unnamed protein product [Adineta steineri]